MRDDFSSDGAPSSFSGRLYRARWHCGSEAFLEDSTLRGLVAKLLQESRTALDAFYIDSRPVSSEEGRAFELPLSVPYEEFSFEVEGRLQFLPLDSIPLHWELPLPHTYVAVDVERALWTHARKLDDLVRRLHQSGCAPVRRRSLTIYALLASSDPQADDVVVVPFDMYTEIDDEDVVDEDVVDEDVVDEDVVDEDVVDEDVVDGDDPDAEVDLAGDVTDHWLFADRERRECKLKQLLS